MYYKGAEVACSKMTVPHSILKIEKVSVFSAIVHIVFVEAIIIEQFYYMRVVHKERRKPDIGSIKYWFGFPLAAWLMSASKSG